MKPDDPEQQSEEEPADSDQPSAQSDDAPTDNDQSTEQSDEQPAEETDQPEQQADDQPAEQAEEQPADSDEPVEQSEGQPAESVFANSYIVSVSPPHLSVSTRTKCEWFGSSGTPGTLSLPLMPVDLPGYVTIPAGATPNSVDLRCCSATA